MIGGIRKARFGQALVDAELDEDGVWHSANRTFEEILNDRYEPDPHPSAGQFGVAAINGAATDFFGEPILPPPMLADPGVVY